MLTEHFIASIAAPTKPNTGVTKDAGIFLHEFQPFSAQRHVFKKSVTSPNCLAVSASHVFAAQTEKAVVHVYNREKGSQEAVIPFQERIHSIALAAQDTVLLLGTESGRILLWETCTGRLTSTSTSHLQRVTTLTVDPTSNFFLSGSPDSLIHVWALPTLLSFSPDASRSPIHTLSTHRAPITSLITGHSSTSANFGISASEDKSAIIWDYQNGTALRTYLLEATPLALALDPADRGFYVSYEDGSVQLIDFFDAVQEASPTDTLRDPSRSHIPVQPPPKTRIHAQSQNLGSALSLTLSYDSTVLLSGHASGKIASWDMGRGSYISTLATLPGSVTNLCFLPVTGFPNPSIPNFKIPAVVKPKHDVASSENGMVPGSYTLSVQFMTQLNVPEISAAELLGNEKSDFEVALGHSSFPMGMLEEAIRDVEEFGADANGVGASSSSADFLAFDGMDVVGSEKQAEEIKELKRKLEGLQQVQKVTLGQLSELRRDREWWVKKEEARERRKRKKAKAQREGVNGVGEEDDGGDSDVDMSDESEREREHEDGDGDAEMGSQESADGEEEEEEESEEESSNEESGEE